MEQREIGGEGWMKKSDLAVKTIQHCRMVCMRILRYILYKLMLTTKYVSPLQRMGIVLVILYITDTFFRKRG